MDYLALISQVGFPSFILYLIIKEVLVPVVKRFSPEGNKTEFNSEAILAELVKSNNNHLPHVQEAIEQGNKEITKAINDSNLRIIQLLGEIKGVLSK